MASLKLPVQIVSTSTSTAADAPQHSSSAGIILSSDMHDIPYIEDADGGGHSPLRQSKSASQTNQLMKKCAFPLTKLKSQYKQLSTNPAADRTAPGGGDPSMPATVKTTTLFSTEPKLTASITSIGGDVMRSKTAEFERMLMQQNKRNTKSNSIDNSTGAYRRNDSKSLPITSSTPTSSNSPQSAAAANRNGPIYKRRDVISSAPNTKK